MYFFSSSSIELRFTSALVLRCLSHSSCRGPVGRRWRGCGCPYCSLQWPARASPVPSAACARASLRRWPSSAPRQGCCSCPRPWTGAPWSCGYRRTSSQVTSSHRRQFGVDGLKNMMVVLLPEYKEYPSIP